MQGRPFGVGGPAESASMRIVRPTQGTAPPEGGLVDRIFVYGSLRTGQSARGLVEPFVREWEPVTVRGELFAFPSGYPGVVLGGNRGLVMGELLWLRDLHACLPILDEYEGADYRRELAEIQHVGGPTWAWIYVLEDPRVAALGTPVPGGEWVARSTSDELGQPAM